MKLVLLAVIALVLGFAAWVRLVPARPANWHRELTQTEPGDVTGVGSHSHKRSATADDFARMDQIIRATARTRVIAGSVDEGRITYETRTALWGFPDYTTLQFDGTDLSIYGRLRFGKGDMGVNKRRITGWLADLDATA